MTNDKWTDEENLEMKRLWRNARARANRKAREQTMRDLGLEKGRDFRGRVIWE